MVVFWNTANNMIFNLWKSKDDLKELPTIPSNCAIIKCLLDPALVSFLDKLDGPVFISTFWCWGFKTVDHDKFSKHQSVQVSEDWWEVSRTFILWRTAWGVKNELFLKFFEIFEIFLQNSKKLKMFFISNEIFFWKFECLKKVTNNVGCFF